MIRRLKSAYEWGSPSEMNGQSGATVVGGQDPAGTAPGLYSPLASWTSDGQGPLPIVLSTEVSQTTSLGLLGSKYYVCPTGWVDTLLQGSCLIRYGVGGLMRERVIDLQSGTFQLPPCDTVVVQGRFYNQHSSGGGNSAQFSASIAPGMMSEPGIATHTGVADVVTGTTSDPFQPPVGTMGYRVYGAPDALVPGADFQLDIAGAQPRSYIDYALPSYAPSTPDLAFASGGVTCRKTGTATGSIIAAALIGF